MFFVSLFFCFYLSVGVDFIPYNISNYLTPNCIMAYRRGFNAREVPPRSYKYFHEVINSNGFGRSGEYDDDLDETQDGEVDIGWRIVGGNEVSIEKVPYQILYGKYCGGALLAPNWAITAAHCKEDDKYIYAGSTKRSLAFPFRICAHFIHPNWYRKQKVHGHDFDYQLLLLSDPVPVTPATRPIAIGEMTDIEPGKKVIVSGWGHTKDKAKKMEDILRRVTVPVMSFDVCTNLPKDYYKLITPRMFCAGLLGGGKDSCQGDSGGPATVRGKLVGLVSFGVGCAESLHPGVYSNLPIVRDWIRSVTGLPL